jgi:hypothetical protein
MHCTLHHKPSGKLEDWHYFRAIPLLTPFSFVLLHPTLYFQPPFTQMFGFLTLNKSAQTFDASRAYWLDHDREVHAKNFIPFLYNDHIHLISSFSPMIVLRLDTQTEGGHGLVTVVTSEVPKTDDAPHVYSLPWLEEYGAHIRGGTPLVPVPGHDYFLTFFHTRVHGPACESVFLSLYYYWATIFWSFVFRLTVLFVRIVKQIRRVVGVDHYFMGAMTICPHPPFEIKHMSRYPLVPDPLWCTLDARTKLIADFFMSYIRAAIYLTQSHLVRFPFSFPSFCR